MPPHVRGVPEVTQRDENDNNSAKMTAPPLVRARGVRVTLAIELFSNEQQNFSVPVLTRRGDMPPIAQARSG